jgi:sigma-B regulation protein RsbU (phosphoserine phosphatase)
MSKLSYFRAKNAMLLACLISNAFGVVAIIFFSRGIGQLFTPEIVPLAFKTTRIFLPCAFLIPICIILIYERPIRLYLNRLRDGQPISEAAGLKARIRLLNEPFFLIGLDFIIWVLAAVTYATVFWAHGAGRQTIKETFFQSIFTGLITVTIAFFVFEFVLQRRVVHYFFPNGGLSMTPGTLRIRIRTRLVALLLAINIVPLLAILGDLVKISPIGEGSFQKLEQLQTIIHIEIFLFICVGIWMVFLVSSNLAKPFEEIIKVLRNIENGDFESRVRVTSNDEIGYTGDAINEMTEGLVEWNRVQQSLKLAREVQQNLLPKENLMISGFDIAGKSVYCDETGGDYYDFIPIGNGAGKKIGIAIGDVAGHGISSALLMATVRSSLRQRVSLPGSTAGIISDVNRQLVRDVEDSGQFMTLFFLILDPESKNLDWVRAGHDPAIVYDPGADSFNELGGRGLALGVDREWIYEDNMKASLSDEQIIFLSTDGVWEVQNPEGRMLGKQPILNTIRQNAASSAAQILEAIFDSVNHFKGSAKIEDDITLVVIKS